MDIIECVTKTWNEYPWEKIERIWVTLQSIYNMIIEHHGCNQFKIPHLNKDQMEWESTLPRELPLTEEAINIMEQYNNSRNGIDPLTDSDVDISDDEADDILATLRGRPNNNDLDGSDNWSMSTEEEVIFRKVGANLEAELKAREDDSDSDEEASTNSDHSLSPEDLAYYKQVEADMLKEGTL
jgi:hypothetical protein